MWGDTSVDAGKLKDFIAEAGEYLVFEVPRKFSVISSELSVGCKLTEELVFLNGMDTQ